MRIKLLIFLLIVLHTVLLLAQISGLSIGYNEATILYTDTDFLHHYIQFFVNNFPYNDLALRFPMIALHVISFFLLYGISRFYLTRETDRLWLMLVYVLLPGITSAALVVDPAGLKIALTFLFVYLFLRFGTYAYALLPLYVWIDASFLPLFLAIIFYGVMIKKYPIALFATALSIIASIRSGIHIGGTPHGHFLDALGIYAAIFSPIVFLYLFYVMYRRFITNERDLLWLIGTVAFGMSLLLSFRQRVEIQSFAPFLMLILPLAAQTFFHTYRIRLREFRKRYQYLFYTALAILVINTLAVFFNQYFYRFLKNPTHHFSYPMHVVKELAGQLHEKNITCVHTEDEKIQLRLRFYGIEKCNTIVLSQSPMKQSNKVTISYNKTPIYITYVSKVHN
ncbi:MAG: glycosyltransferase family 39 protein [Epsilonproteobacteria bacterium]|nr:glycosyltransferase family 39 protein [Campylobacterota bacterium]